MGKIDTERLKRDYLENPLKICRTKNGSEFPYEEDIRYLYLELNMSLSELATYFNCSTSFVSNIFKKYNIKKPKELKNELRCKTNLEKYGCENATRTPEANEKRRKTNLEKYGCENPFQNKEIKEKIKKSLMETYGVEHPMLSKDIKSRLKQTNLEKYGCENPFQNKEIKEKIKKTNLERYGTENVSQNHEIRLKAEQTTLERYGKKYYTQTKEYIVKNNKTREEHYLDDLYCREKYRKTCEEKYGVINYSQTKEFKNRYKDEDFKNKFLLKKFETEKKNGTLGKSISKEELKILEILKTRFPNVQSQYYSEKYPFKCDFYIPETDTYIEYNGFWTHGFEPYIGSDKQNELIKLWESKNTEQYKRAIKTWSERDPLKRKTAKNNGLNHLEFFNMNQFEEWFESLDK